MPMLLASTAVIFVWRFMGDGVAVFWMGLKKAWSMSRPLEPSKEVEGDFCIVSLLYVISSSSLDFDLLQGEMLGDFIVYKEERGKVGVIGEMKMKTLTS